MCWDRIKKIFNKKQHVIENGRRVLAIDDDAGQCVMIQKTLENQGYRVLLAEDGAKGLETAFKERPDVILLDVLMPGMRGDEVCRKLKSDDRTKDIPVLFLTSLNDPKDVITHYDLGAEIHLTKPINPKELISQIEITLKSKSS